MANRRSPPPLLFRQSRRLFQVFSGGSVALEEEVPFPRFIEQSCGYRFIVRIAGSENVEGGTGDVGFLPNCGQPSVRLPLHGPGSARMGDGFDQGVTEPVSRFGAFVFFPDQTSAQQREDRLR